MGNGLLAEWRRGIVARGLLGAALLAVPVAVAAAIGFGTSLSGLTGGLSSLASGPDTAPAAQRGPGNLAPAAAALTGTTGGNGGISNGGGNAGGGVGGIGGTGSGSTGSGSTQAGGSGPSVPDVNLPTGGSTGSTANNAQGAVNNVIGGVNSTVGQVLGGH